MIEIELKDRAILSLLDRIRERMGNLRPALDKIGEEVMFGIQDIFEQQGPGWAPLSPRSTIPNRERKGHWPGQILKESGGMLRSIHYQSGDDEVTVSANKIYAALQHFGSNRTWYRQVSVKGRPRWMMAPWGGHAVPARPFMRVTDSTWQTIQEVLSNFLLGVS